MAQAIAGPGRKHGSSKKKCILIMGLVKETPCTIFKELILSIYSLRKYLNKIVE